MMNSELNNHQTDWLAQTEELNDLEASQVNGGMDSVGASGAAQQSAENQAAMQAAAQQSAQQSAAMSAMQAAAKNQAAMSAKSAM